MKITAEFVTSAAGTSGLPRGGLAEVALVGRSNVGKSSLINALVRRTVARTSGAPGKTRLANIYRVARGQAAAIHLIDLPGYGFARKATSARAAKSAEVESEPAFEAIAEAVFAREPAALLLVDARHPGLDERRGSLDVAAADGRADRRRGDQNRQTRARRTDPRDESNSNPCLKIPCCRSRRSRAKDWTNCGN